MTSTSGITQGLPPLPKSLNSLWSIGKESLSKAEASLGLKATTSASSTNSGKIISNFENLIENQECPYQQLIFILLSTSLLI